MKLTASHEPPGFVGAEVTRRNGRANRTARLLTSAPTGFMVGEQVQEEHGATHEPV
jgi:hypothetical protein